MDASVVATRTASGSASLQTKKDGLAFFSRNRVSCHKALARYPSPRMLAARSVKPERPRGLLGDQDQERYDQDAEQRAERLPFKHGDIAMPVGGPFRWVSPRKTNPARAADATPMPTKKSCHNRSAPRKLIALPHIRSIREAAEQGFRAGSGSLPRAGRSSAQGRNLSCTGRDPAHLLTV